MSGQGDDTAAAAAAAQVFLDALAAERWAEAAALMDPEMVAWEYARWIEMDAPEVEEWTTERFMAQDPAMPRDVAEHEAAELRRQLERDRGGLSLTFAGVDSVAELRSLSAAQAMARYLEAQDPRARRQSSRERDPDRSVELFAAGGPPSGGRVLGVVPVGDRAAVALHTGGYTDVAGGSVGLLFLHRDDGWRILPPLAPPFAFSGGSETPREPVEPFLSARAAAEHRPGSPAAVVDIVARALHDRDWAVGAALADPESLEAWHRQAVQERRARERRGVDPPAEQLMREHPDLPEPVARYRAEKLRQAARMERGMAGPLDTLGAGALAALEPLEAFALHLQTVDLGESIRRFHRFVRSEMADRLTAEQLEEIAPVSERPAGWGGAVVGVLVDGAVAYVVYREGFAYLSGDTAAGGPMEYHVARLHRTPAGWRLDARDRLYNTGQNVGFTFTPAP